MRVIQDGTTLNIATDSVEGGIITINNVGATNKVGVTVDFTIEDNSGTEINTTNWSIVNETLSVGSIALDTWTIGNLDAGNSETADFDIQIDVEANFPSRFILKATFTGSDDDSSNNIASRTFDVIKCGDVSDCIVEFSELDQYADDAAAAIGGVAVGEPYYDNTGLVRIRIA
jgi:hypothetical protein